MSQDAPIGLFEWGISGTISVLGALAGFLWRESKEMKEYVQEQSARLDVIESGIALREASMERRHQENLDAGRELNNQMRMLTGRIDALMHSNGERRGR